MSGRDGVLLPGLEAGKLGGGRIQQGLQRRGVRQVAGRGRPVPERREVVGVLVVLENILDGYRPLAPDFKM
jgi:hypothetical protein